MIEAYTKFVAAIGLQQAIVETGARETMSDAQFEIICGTLLSDAQQRLYEFLDSPTGDIEVIQCKLEAIDNWYASDSKELSSAIACVRRDLLKLKMAGSSTSEWG